MSIRVRLVLSYLGMLVVLFVLSIIAMAIIFHIYEGRDYPMRKSIEQEADLYAEIKLMSIREPGVLLQRSVAERFDERLSEIGKMLIIRVNKEIQYASLDINKSELPGLPEFGTVSEGELDFFDKSLIIRHEDFLLPDGREASLFVVTDENPFPKYVFDAFMWVAVMVLLILALTNGLLTYLVSRSIIRPLKVLQRATEEIKEGNLDHVVKSRSKDEIGKLSVAFEEMRKKLKESIELQLQYEENRKELVSNISHDLKTPVTAIKGYVEGIMDGVTDSPDKLDKYVRTIYSKAVDMDRMIEELFLISKLELGRLPFHFERVDLGEYLRDCAHELVVDMEKRGIKLELNDLPETAVLIQADREKLKRVLMNILENAMKYMDKADGKVGMNVSVQEGKALIRISDNGQGIEAAALPHIFDRFYRADPSRNSSTGGSGLGLSIARQIVEEHGGRIWADSEAGKGTTVCISIPLWSKREREGDKHEHGVDY
ncbi:sensor histidine kinase [Cohnella cholangitidis]|uniref:histidine kinase n=1 Tax=Cohnella cholangitidis TaxID=2598458 RepID=A0A7G5C1F6_9BACL|nr:HAMP domain-containing sensor histidine kinase [Cohnella cholangitidis]QMV43040.1 HAMP domain-containing histidine kinase [Cohnella cholangitidis]